MNPNNRVINNLTAIDKDRWGNDLALIELKKGEILFDLNTPWKYVYFPIDCIVSLSIKNDDGQYNGFTLIGNEGMVGVSPLLGDSNNEYRAKVEHAGKAYCLPIDMAMQEAHQPCQFNISLLRYLQALVASSLQKAICDSKHTTLGRLCCELLICDDRLSGKASQLDQQWLVNVIGTTKDKLAGVICDLNNKEFLEADRGQVAITNRMGLEKRSCECYQLIKNQFDHLLPAFSPQK